MAGQLAWRHPGFSTVNFSLMLSEGNIEMRRQHGGREFVMLDGLRGVAAIAIAVLHMPFFFPGLALPNAGLAVDLFLQISGFIIAFAYKERLSRGLTLRDFMLHRIIRLYPTFLIGILLGLIFMVWLVGFSPRGAFFGHLAPDGTSDAALIRQVACVGLPNLLMLPQMFCPGTRLMFPINYPMWSIFFELLVNVLFVLCFARLMLIRTALSLIVLFAVLLAFMTLDGKGTLNDGFLWDGFGVGFLRLSACFLIGVLVFNLGLVARRQSDIGCLALMVLLSVLLFWPQSSWSLKFGAIFVICPALLISAIRIDPGSALLRRICLRLGKVSYPLYVIHAPLYLLTSNLLRQKVLGLEAWAGVWGVWPGVVAIAVCLGLSLLIADRYDPWARAVLARLLAPLRSRPPAG